MNIEDSIKAFEKTNKNCVIAYGGDGTLLEVARANEFKKAVFPIRNYGLCDEHAQLFDELLGKAKICRDFKQTIHPLLEVRFNGKSDVAAAEVTVKNKDITSCMRFDVIVNDKLYMENVICDGVIFATSLGSHGYFKSVTRTIFKGYDTIGIGFIAPTYSINNLVLELTDKISIRARRDTTIIITADKNIHTDSFFKVDDEITITNYAQQNLSLFGYDIFCCPNCRKNRNSTTINDQYL